jgi:rRNA maturation RNase YbeY
MSRILSLSNRQESRLLDLLFLRKISRHLLSELLERPTFEIAIHLVADDEMAILNETFLHHEGPTDVITFDYTEPARAKGRQNDSPPPPLHGEIFVCVDEACRQARRFRTTWPAEIVRYIVHGVLHLEGHDDQTPAARRKMKREENRLVLELRRAFSLRRTQRPDRRRAPVR